jgi:hypothetical protein
MGPFGWIYLALLGWALTEIALLSWKRPERLDSSWGWTWPAPTRELHWIGPEPPRLPEVAVAGPGWIRWNTGEVTWLDAPTPAPVTVDPVHIGATADWSPRHAAAEAEAGMLPLDDVDEWLAGRLREYEHALSRIECRTVSLVRGEPQRTLWQELDAFVAGSQQLHAYRDLRIGATGGYGPREHMQLEALLSA